ncbi:MAG: hypothetical protein WB609_14155 [Candidatus Cybelea sp.]
MSSLVVRKAAGMATGLLLLAACGGGGVPSAASSVPGGAAPLQHRAPSPNFSGEYAGPFHDNVYGKGKGSAFYAEQGASTGGVLTIAYPSMTLTASVSQVANGSTVNGTTVGGAGSLYCSFSTTATYDSAKHDLKGTFTAVYGCTGEHGSFKLHQKCFFKGQGSGDIRPENGPHPC